MVSQYSIVAFQNTSVLVVVEEANQIKKLVLQKNIHTEKISSYGSFVHDGIQYFYTSSHDKFVKFWIIEGDNLVIVKDSMLPKKVTHSFYSKETNTHFATDKYGDIYTFPIEKILKKEGDLYPEYQNSNNLAIQQSFKDITIDEHTNYCVMGDSYSKIKLFDLRNMHDLLNMWIPFESHLISILEYAQTAVFLFQMKDSETLEKRYALHLVEKSNFSNSNYTGENIESIQIADNATKVRIEKKNDHQFTIYSVTKSSEVSAQVFDIQEKKLVSSSAGKLNFTLEQGQALFLHLQSVHNGTVAVCGVKQNTPQDFALTEVTNVEITNQLQIKSIHSQQDLIIFS